MTVNSSWWHLIMWALNRTIWLGRDLRAVECPHFRRTNECGYSIVSADTIMHELKGPETLFRVIKIAMILYRINETWAWMMMTMTMIKKLIMNRQQAWVIECPAILVEGLDTYIRNGWCGSITTASPPGGDHSIGTPYHWCMRELRRQPVHHVARTVQIRALEDNGESNMGGKEGLASFLGWLKDESQPHLAYNVVKQWAESSKRGNKWGNWVVLGTHGVAPLCPHSSVEWLGICQLHVLFYCLMRPVSMRFRIGWCTQYKHISLGCLCLWFGTDNP